MTNDDLLAPFRRGVKARSDFRLGIELEYFPVRRHDLRMVPYEGAGGIGDILARLAERFGWRVVKERGKVIALSRDGASVTLEPGGAMEYSSAPAEDLATIETRVRRFLEEAKSVMDPLGAGFLALGFHPSESPESVELVPKARYHAMYEAMPRVGAGGRFMMKLTCAIQLAVDFDSEPDALRKLELASRLTPHFVALSANSFVRDGHWSGRASNRALAWLDTDASRCGFQPFLFGGRDRRELGFSDYVEWALDAPMYFVVRGDRQISIEGLTFRDFARDGARVDGARLEATSADWGLHLNTLFPWARLRDFVEIRAFDMNPLPRALGFAALVKGVFDDSGALADAEALCGDRGRADVEGLLDAAIARGLDGEAAGTSLRESCGELLGIARHGLERASPSETSFLEPLDDLIAGFEFVKMQRSYRDALDESLRDYLVI